jgi:hypothetical protein
MSICHRPLHVVVIHHIQNVPYLEIQTHAGYIQILQTVQMFVLGPRLILSLREYHANLVADSDTATVMTSICFQERVHVETGSSV